MAQVMRILLWGFCRHLKLVQNVAAVKSRSDLILCILLLCYQIWQCHPSCMYPQVTELIKRSLPGECSYIYYHKWWQNIKNSVTRWRILQEYCFFKLSNGVELINKPLHKIFTLQSTWTPPWAVQINMRY